MLCCMGPGMNVGFGYVPLTQLKLGYKDLAKKDPEKGIWLPGHDIIKEKSIKNKLKMKISF